MQVNTFLNVKNFIDDYTIIVSDIYPYQIDE